MAEVEATQDPQDPKKNSTKKTTKKKVTKKKAAAPKESPSKIAERTRAMILKATNHKTVKPRFSTMDHVPSGSSTIDDLIGGTLAQDGKGPICPGYPRRYITEVFGKESSGKTTAALQAIATIQRAGGLAMFLDFEHALHTGYAKSIGVSLDESKLLHYAPNTFEEGLRMLYLGIRNGVDLIVCDSVAAMVPESEKDKTDKASQIGALARAMSDRLPKIGIWLHSPEHSGHPLGTAVIFINQTRALIKTNAGPRGGGGDSTNTSGGAALKFYAYLRLQFTKLRNDTIKKKDKFTGKERTYPYGTLTQVKIIKSKIDAKIGFASDIFIRYGYGIDDYFSIIEAAITNKIVKKNGANYSYGSQSFRGREKFRTFLVENPKVFTEIREKVLGAVRNPDLAQAQVDEEEEEIMSVMEQEFGPSSGSGGAEDDSEAEEAEEAEVSPDEDIDLDGVREDTEEDESDDESDE